ncbi:DUF2309 domain-containing protein [Cyclobacterium qasimii]|uniref:Probable inorganic carbon transporter subunit DabA n=2 Tax=Cyclobacterium qasimii TaxID=1350429 RepID=S7V623_9BACT|nr:DUF2309 domain-containing protein [Cyclobacterium qasimii]EPR65336.1 putative transmembrane protein [Cyclobacterium qasimii M12-11B]GEO21869.1 UPF0753 protein [Cyclobacterium qasimii]
MNQYLLSSIDKAAEVIGKTWPLYTFVASNPLAGYEKAPFLEAVSAAQKQFNANAFPAAKLYRQAWEKGDIDLKVLDHILKVNGLSKPPDDYLKILEEHQGSEEVNGNHNVDRLMVKWLSAFMDEGLAEWEMPYKSEGFYTAWRLLVIYDTALGPASLNDIPKTSEAALVQLLSGYPENDYVKIFSHHLAALPGWVGYIKHRTESNSDWQQDFPIDLMDYLAVRLWIAQKLNVTLLPEDKEANTDGFLLKLQYIWLQAWEQSWQNQLVISLENGANITQFKGKPAVPDAQMVFCIDTRSELIRRHVESKGNYETFGYAGFFGIAMDYQSPKDGITRKACPPIVSSAYTVSESAQVDKKERFLANENKNERMKFGDYFLKRMKNMLPAAFGYVEGSGVIYGLSLLARTIIPGSIYRKKQKNISQMEATCQPDITKISHENKNLPGVSLEEKVSMVKSAFDLMGWKQFAPLVLFVGHGSHSANNPFGSSLDCGACAASPGRHNARMLAKMANLLHVRKALAEIHGVLIPETTLFLGAEHNTTTDEIVLFDSEAPESHAKLIANLKLNLLKAQQSATQNRLGTSGDSVSKAQEKANNWGETRPEWGLAKNAGFIVGPRDLTKNTNLDSRCFLHSYDWELDTTGKALEGIMQGPLVVTQWINNHYYFSTVDNNTYGGGSKITHNITGKFGVVQGNGGDLKMGLPLQSLYSSDNGMYHQPLRLTVTIQAPINRIADILERNNHLKSLLDNEWIYLMVMDPMQKNEIFKYKKTLKWESASSNKASGTQRTLNTSTLTELAV